MSDEFTIDTPEKAAWAMRKYRSLAQKRERNISLAEAEKNRIEAWLERVNERVEGEMEFFHGHLEGFARAERAQGRKSVDLPDGVIKTRAKSQRLVLDKSAFVQWALETDREDLLRKSYAPDMDEINERVVMDGGKAVLSETGEILPHADVMPESVGVSITPDLDAADLEEEDDA